MSTEEKQTSTPNDGMAMRLKLAIKEFWRVLRNGVEQPKATTFKERLEKFYAGQGTCPRCNGTGYDGEGYTLSCGTCNPSALERAMIERRQRQ